MQMVASKNAFDLVRESEGCELTAYQDSVGVWTNGYGNTHNVVPGSTITQAQADRDLALNLLTAEKAVNQLCDGVRITQNQFDALVSFVFNLGSDALRGSTLLRYLKAGDVNAAANQFTRWDKAGGKVLKGLTKRRAAERELFLRP